MARQKRRNQNPRKRKSDEDVLIEFMPFIKANNSAAIAIHESYVANNDAPQFLAQARQFLEDQQSHTTTNRTVTQAAASIPPQAVSLHQQTGPPVPPTAAVLVPPPPGLASPPGLKPSTIAPPVTTTTTTTTNSPLPPSPLFPSTLPPILATPVTAPAPPPPPAVHPIGSPLPPPPTTTTPMPATPLPPPTPSSPARHTPKTEDGRTPKPRPKPKRTLTYPHQQPGQILISNVNGHDASRVLLMAPRQAVSAEWTLPQAHFTKSICIGLFRRGGTENSRDSAIIAKRVVEYDHFLGDGGVYRGTVPFYAPRTPGNVVFRLIDESNPTPTLAVSVGIRVHVARHLEAAVKLSLSNFKKSKTNPLSLSNVLTLATILECPLQQRVDPSVGRALWGCILEARKVIRENYEEYKLQSHKLAELEVKVDELTDQLEIADDPEPLETQKSETLRQLLSGRASAERKWRDAQLAWASILQHLQYPRSLGSVLRREQLAPLRAEFQVWCPLSEEFACDEGVWFEQPIPDPVRSLQSLQQRTLGFILNATPLERVLFPQADSMDRAAVSVFNTLSGAMGTFYRDLFENEETVVRQREMVRQKTEGLVEDVFPKGTRVLVFGSAANGFGSPKSDMDMCLHIPPGFNVEEDGVDTMAKLAAHLEASGMVGVDTSRLTARIPIIKYYCPNPLKEDDPEDLVECDISMRNPLAVLNTSLLRTYAEITPVTRVLGAVIKRWAKARDINSPARHTLSSYGYVIMLLHFLTYHKRGGRGLVVPVDQQGDGPPLLPNLQWMDPRWPQSPDGTPYTELRQLPREMKPHPMKDHNPVNTYFYKPPDNLLQRRFHNQDISLSILLASFFRYYALEFDYKHHVVSLRGPVDREVKAERDLWRNYSAALAIEDPFELDYDVAHVLRGGYFHRIRREFGLAYTKIVDAAQGRSEHWERGNLQGMTGQALIDWICEPVETEADGEVS